MKNTKILIRELRDEYLNICKKIATAKFALKTLPFDEQEKSDLQTQIWGMESYANKLVDRASYAAKNNKENLND